jgi:peroxiredoxin
MSKHCVSITALKWIIWAIIHDAPGYAAKYDELIALGIDEVYCLSVNDAFSMFQWSKQLKINNVKMLPDGNADFTRLMGMLVKKENIGYYSPFIQRKP